MLEPVQHPLDLLLSARELDFDRAVVAIAHPTVHAEAFCFGAGGEPKADPLHSAAHDDTKSGHGRAARERVRLVTLVGARAVRATLGSNWNATSHRKKPEQHRHEQAGCRENEPPYFLGHGPTLGAQLGGCLRSSRQ